MPDKKLTEPVGNSNRLTVAEIKKALECCAESGDFTKTQDEICFPCPYCNCGDCTGLLKANALDLINRLEFRIHQQEKTIMEIQNANLIDWNATIGNYKAENESLKAEVERLKAKVNHYNYLYKVFVDRPIADIKAEAYKEFATKTTDKVEKVKQKYERLCKEQGEKMEEHMHIHFNGIIKIVKDLLNELVGGENGL